MKNEQAEQRRRPLKGELDRGLEATFPASDPVSVTHSAVSTGRTDISAAERVRDNDDEYPVVDESLRSAGDSDNGRENIDTGEARGLRLDAARLSKASFEVASGAANVTKAHIGSFWSDVENKVRENPLTAVGVVAAISFLWGATR
jgi:hypothetical protein